MIHLSHTMAPRISENDVVFDPSRHCIVTDPTLPSILPMNFKRDEHIAADPLGVLEAGLEGVKNAYINNTFLDPDSTTRRKNDEDLNAVRRRVEQFMETFTATHPQHRRPHWRFWQAKVVYLLDDDDVAAVAKHYKGCEEAYFQVTVRTVSKGVRHALTVFLRCAEKSQPGSALRDISTPSPCRTSTSTT
ncbi:hypothetical protein EXIGLDRAFT_258045 [Exidia glandulosa HHB12029]|uniref:Uncharacterized protein n=1 Tax=Exidia glandulosa HHB12029 TaxID=1314781 RepID=A0A165MD23_EXIGL|nr:hypothetical protein EXIGLDRAFT_258045 [Exidia glandulosa HHB12029]